MSRAIANSWLRASGLKRFERHLSIEVQENLRPVESLEQSWHKADMEIYELAVFR